MPTDSSTSLLSPGEWKTTEPNSERQGNPQRPSFSSSVTADRLRESEKWRSPSITSKTGVTGVYCGNEGRRSVFKEIGLEDYEIANKTGLSALSSSTAPSGNTSVNDMKDSNKDLDSDQKSWYWKLAKPSRPIIKSSASAPPSTLSSFPRVAILAFLIAIVIPGMRYGGTRLDINVPADGVGAGPIEREDLIERGMEFERRDNSATDICTRWSHQSAVVNGTLYVYGGQAKTSATQSSNTWNNNFLTLDLTKQWAISSPSLTTLPQPSGPPAVANGYLWNSFTSLFLYGGLFSDTPPANPVPFSTWEYSIPSKTWIEHTGPLTSGGNNSDPSGLKVQRSAEGAGISVPELGLSWYFGGHQDLYTTVGWSNQIARIYLKSLLEFTHPGYLNNGVQSLGAGTNGAPTGGVYRNVTQGGVQDSAGFPERADGILVYVPGWGTQGILLGLAGGQEQQTFTELNVIDVYDIASSTWYKQSTSGKTPNIRVNACAVVFAAPDGSSYNVYVYGGQNLQPYRGQTQYSDIWILSIPSFTWIQADLSGQSEPPPRAGHTCHAWDGQMVVVGGYVGQQISCDSPGIYVFNASSLKWQNNFVALSGGNDLNQQPAQASQGLIAAQQGGATLGTRIGLSGSYGYLVPAAIQSVIGGNSYGSATATTPAAGSATAGPIATGQAPLYVVSTITQSGSTIVQTSFSTATATSVSSQSSPASTPASSGPNLGAIIAGVIAGVLALIACYLAFCTWLYRRQLVLYKNHVAMSQRTALGYSNSPDNRMRNEKFGPTLGVFGTEVAAGRGSGSNSAGRGSMSGNSGPSSGSGLAPNATRIDSHSTAGNTSEPTPDSTEYAGAAIPSAVAGAHGWGRLSDRGSTSSSTEDLLAGQEPSFISVVLSPRRTLRVINRD